VVKEQNAANAQLVARLAFRGAAMFFYLFVL
jgi:hypothetical protein